MNDYNGKIIDAHAYLDESRVSASDLNDLAEKNSISSIIVSPACTKEHEPDKHPAMYWLQRLLLKTGVFLLFARLISASFYNEKGELRGLWKLFTRNGKDLKKVMDPDNDGLAKKISGYEENLKMWYWVNPNEQLEKDKLFKKFQNKQIFGLKIHAYWHNIDLAKIGPYLEFCREANCPLYLILGYGKSSNVSLLLKNFSDVKVILGYGGFPLFSRVWNLIEDSPNILIDLASFHLDRDLIKKALKKLGARRCVFGTDCPYNFYDDLGNFSYSKTFDRLNFGFLDPKDYELIFHKNIINTSKLSIK